MSLSSLCTPRPSVFSAERRATVLNLNNFLIGEVEGDTFFEENYFTVGMETLVERALKQLSGQISGSSVFLLSQAMGGGKTHSMMGLGLLARDPALRKRVMGVDDPAPSLPATRVIGFEGRNTDSSGGVCGELARQLGKEDEFSQYTSGALSAPGPEAWKKLLGEEPVIIFLDEIPFYLQYAVSVSVGNSDLSVVTSTALANLFVAVTDLNNACLVLSDLAGHHYSGGQTSLEGAFNSASKSITDESRRIAVPLTPVNPNGDELYHILRKRLFEKVASEEQIQEIATAYQASLREAEKMGLTSTAPETLSARIRDSYPFHPDLRELVGKFKENSGFQQTRGVIRLMQIVVSNLWEKETAESLDLIAPYNLDLNSQAVADEVKQINSALSEAIAHDIAREGDSEVEHIDQANKNTDASDAAKLVLMASLSTTPGAAHGLREHQLIDCLQRPGRDLSTFKTNVLDKLDTRAWYLHRSADGRLFFKNQQNLAAKLRSTAQSLHAEVVEGMLRKRLESYFAPTVRDCFQNLKVLPPLDEVQLEQGNTTLLIVRPGGTNGTLPISADWQSWWEQQQYKNRVLFLTGSRDTFQKVLDSARQTRALESIEEELRAESTPSDDPQWRALDTLKDRVGLQFSAALKEAFDQIVYPSIKNSLRATGVDLAFAGNQNGESTIRHTLGEADKFTQDISEDSFRSYAEAKLFGGESKTVLWADFKRAAAVKTEWPFHKTSALDDLKAECFRRDLWREEGNYVRRGPFPPADPKVNIRVLSTDDDNGGVTYLKIEGLNQAPSVVYETGESAPTTASSPVPTPQKFEARSLRYRFLAFDPDDLARTSPIEEWCASLRLKHDLQDGGDHFKVTLQALPTHPEVSIRFTTDGSSPSHSGAAVYDGPIRVPENCRIICACAVAPELGLTSEKLTVNIPKRGEEERTIDPQRPARWTARTKLDESGQVWEFLAQFEKSPQATAHDLSLTAESENGQQVLDYTGSRPEGYAAVDLRQLSEKLQEIVATTTLRMTVGSLSFPSGQSLLDWVQESGQSFDLSKVTQS